MVSHTVDLVLAMTKTLTLVFGGVLTYLSYKAFRRTDSCALRALTVGIALLTGGALLGGVLHQIGGLTLEYSVSVQSVFTALGFGVMTYSLFADVSRSDGPIESGVGPGD